MAITKIWAIKGRLDHVVLYVDDPTKTENVSCGEYEMEAAQGLQDVMDYAMETVDTSEDNDTLQTLMEYAADNTKTSQQHFVSGINCDPDTARRQMIATKKGYGKEDGIIAFHAVQSFAPGEVDAATAHKIGKELAHRLWGDRFEVLVATHCNTDCIHTHFVVNSVSFVDGYKFYASKATYAHMRSVSDELCREYQLSVIEQFQDRTNKRHRHYAEWQAENAGQQIWRTAIREDVKTAIAASMTWTAFLKNLRAQGYEIKTGVKHIAVRPPGKERFVRLRSLGDAYTEDAIKRRILRQQVPTRMPHAAPPTASRGKFNSTFDSFTLQKVTYKSIRALYYHYLRKLRQAREPNAPAPFPLRDDLRIFDQIVAQFKYLQTHKIDTDTQLLSRLSIVTGEADALIAERKALSDEKRRTGTPDIRKVEITEKVAEINAALKGLRQEVRLCDGILERSLRIREKQEILQQYEQQQKEHDRNTGRARSRPEEHMR